MSIKRILNSFVYTGEQELTVNDLKPYVGHEWDESVRDKNIWGLGVRRDNLKAYIKDQLTLIQGLVCAYCGLNLMVTSGTYIDHIAPKKQHPEFIFEPYNLAFSCSLCNGFDKKSTHDTISIKNNIYSLCDFNIVHPYLDDPTQHYSYLNVNGIPCMIQLISDKAAISNELFELDSPLMTQERYKEGLLKTFPLPNDDELLISSIINNKESI